jgi:hypothetical protein
MYSKRVITVKQVTHCNILTLSHVYPFPRVAGAAIISTEAVINYISQAMQQIFHLFIL